MSAATVTEEEAKLTLSQVLFDPAFTADMLAGHGWIVRRLVGLTDLPARAKALLKELVDKADYHTWQTGRGRPGERLSSPSAAYLAQQMGCTRRTVRRGYVDLEAERLLSRKSRSWMTSIFTIHVSPLLQLARQAVTKRGDRERRAIEEHQARHPQPFQRATRTDEGSSSAAPSSAADWSDILNPLSPIAIRFPALRAAYAHAVRVLGARGVSWRGLASVHAERKADLAVLSVAVRAYLEPEADDHALISKAAGLSGPLGTTWKEVSYPPVPQFLADVAALIEVHGGRWSNKLRRRWQTSVDQAYATLGGPTINPADGLATRRALTAEQRAAQEEAARHEMAAQGLILDAAERARLEEERHRAEAAAQLEAERAAQAEADRIRGLLPARAAVVASIAAALEALEPLPDVSSLPLVDPERRRVRTLHRHRVALLDAVTAWDCLDPEQDPAAAWAASEEVLRVAAALGIGPPG